MQIRELKILQTLPIQYIISSKVFGGGGGGVVLPRDREGKKFHVEETTSWCATSTFLLGSAVRH